MTSNYKLSIYIVDALASAASHELGHAVQMVTDGQTKKPNKTDMYYDYNSIFKHDKIKNHRGPHCRTGFLPAEIDGTCVMYGKILPSNQTFCSTSGAVQDALINAKKNDCTMAVRKVDRCEPFKGYR